MHVKLWRARSRLYQRRLLRPNTPFSSFFEVYKIITLLHRAKPKIAAKNRQTFSQIFKQFACLNFFFPFFFKIGISNPREKHEKHEHRKILSSIAERDRKIHIFGKLLQIPDLLCASPQFLHACLHDPEAPKLGVLDFSLSCDPQNCIRFHRPNFGTPSFETTLHR